MILVKVKRQQVEVLKLIVLKDIFVRLVQVGRKCIVARQGGTTAMLVKVHKLRVLNAVMGKSVLMVRLQLMERVIAELDIIV